MVRCAVQALAEGQKLLPARLRVRRQRLHQANLSKMDELCLKWSHHKSSFLQCLSSLCLSEHLTDVILSCGSKEFSAHKLVLSVCSDYFQGLFERIPHFTVPGTKPVVVLKDVEPRFMELLLHFMYHGHINVSENDLLGFLAAAKGLQIKGLAVPDTIGSAAAESFNPMDSSPVSIKRSGSPEPPQRSSVKRRKSKKSKVSISSVLGSSLDQSDNQSLNELQNTLDQSQSSKFETEDDNVDMTTYVEVDDVQEPVASQAEASERDNTGENSGPREDLYLQEEAEVTDVKGVMAPYYVIHGQMHSSSLYVCDGNVFSLSRTQKMKDGKTKGYLRCRHRDCCGSAFLFMDSNVVTKVKGHTCSDNNAKIAIIEVKNDIRNKCLNTTDDLKDVYKNAIASRPEIASEITYESMQVPMRRWRNKALENLMHQNN